MPWPGYAHGAPTVTSVCAGGQGWYEAGVRPGLYAIVDVEHPHGLDPAAVARAMLGDRPAGGTHGASVIQLRAKDATTAQRTAWAQAIVAVCRPHGVPVVVNDDVEAATASGADGVHLGQDDPGARDIATTMQTMAVGLSTHDLGQLRDAGRLGPTYLAYGPVRATSSKANPDPTVGLDGLLDAARIAARPLVAIGGLDATHGARAIEIGASAVAVIGALVHGSLDAIEAAAVELSRSFEAAGRPLELDEVAAKIPVLEPDLLAELARWGDSLGTHVQLKLPARFRPWVEDGRPQYRPCDVMDLVHALGKRPGETWAQWQDRVPEEEGRVIALRRR